MNHIIRQTIVPIRDEVVHSHALRNAVQDVCA